MPLQEPAASILRSLVHSLSHAPNAHWFWDLPDAKMYPDYYIYIKEPKSLSQITVSNPHPPPPPSRASAQAPVGG